MASKISVGGQAVIEGVMMRSPRSFAVAVRRPAGEIAIRESAWRSLWDRFKFLKWPFIRGTVVMVEAMMNGISALNFSAAESMPANDGENVSPHRGAAMVFPLLLSVLLAVALFKFVPHMAATYAGELFVGRQWTVDDGAYHLVDGLVKVVLFIGYVAGIGLMSDIKRVFMYHGAEHKAIYAYEAKLPLTVENARKQSRLHPRCGTSFLMVVILVFIVVSAMVLPWLPDVLKPGPDKPFYTHLLLVLAKLPLLIPVAGIAYEFNRFAGRHVEVKWLQPLLWPGMMMQLLTTRVPTDDQLEIALTALRTSLWREAAGADIEGDEQVLVFKGFSEFVAAGTDLRAQVD